VNIRAAQPIDHDATKQVIVIGAGPVGIRFCTELLKHNRTARVTIFGNEPYQPYNRVQLSSLLAGDTSYEDIITKLPDSNYHPNFEHVIAAIRNIDKLGKEVVDIHGNSHAFDKLVIATGARPHRPNIPGIDQTGVYTFRNLKDAEFLFARVSRARHIVIVGGGLLGLESAKALSRFNTRVTLVQQGPHLMNRQLDEETASKLQTIVKSLGIQVIINSGVRRVIGNGRVTGVLTRDKETIECDTVLLCAGIKPNLEIARNARISVQKGILVDDKLQTSAHNIFAIGECCEHRGSTYGVVNPGYEQAAILANIIQGGKARYKGSLEISRLKIFDVSICSMGEVSNLEKRSHLREIKYHNNKYQQYRKIVTHHGKLTGAVGFGKWDEWHGVLQIHQDRRRLWAWQLIFFIFKGRLFYRKHDNINLRPKSTVVCQCNNISQGEIVEAIDRGSNSLEKLQQNTGAGTVCGSCQPFLGQLLGYTGPAEKQKAWAVTLCASVLAGLIVMAITFLPALSTSNTVQSKNFLENIWNDKFWKQVTGFSLLGMSMLGLLMSIRKRVASMSFGDYSYWRVLHVGLGFGCASALVLHTGLSLGENYNQVLMIDFMGIIFLGSFSGAIMSLSHKFSAETVGKIHRFWTWAHIFFTWPLPVLLSFHILTVYYF